MPTLAELRAQSGPQPLPRKTVSVTLVEGQHLLAESEALMLESQDLVREETRLKEQASRTNSDGDQSGPPRKAGEGADVGRRLAEIEARFKEIRARLDALVDEMADYQGEVTLTGITGGQWELFKSDNPIREGNRNDLVFASGACDSSALFAALGRFVTAWDGDPVAEGEWDKMLAERITYADRRDLVTAVVKMHEVSSNRVPKSRSASATTSPSESA